jgi:hypothetical protein
MNIYVDFDDVICETARDLSALAARLYSIQAPYSTIKAFDLHEAFGLNEDQYQRLMAVAHSREVILGYTETPGATATLNRWASQGHTVEVVTGRPFSTAAASREWLDAHDLSHIPIIHVDKYGREPPTAPGAPRALTTDEFALRHYDFAVEDSPPALVHLAKMESCLTAVFARPWNRTTPMPSPAFVRCEDWAAVDALLQRRLGQDDGLRRVPGEEENGRSGEY